MKQYRITVGDSVKISDNRDAWDENYRMICERGYKAKLESRNAIIGVFETYKWSLDEEIN